MLSRQKRARRSALRVRSILLAAVLGVGTISPLGERQALATTDSWLPTSSGLWGTPSNWSQNAIPTLNEDVNITNSFSGSQTIALNITPGVVFHSLTLDATGGGTNVFQTGNNNLSFGPVGETIGNSGNAIFQQQGGADTLTNAVLIVANNVGSTGTYVLASGATLAANNSNEFVGYNGVGTFAHVGGTNTLGPVLDLGTGSTGNGTYLLTAGNLVASNSAEMIGDGGVGNFQLVGGTHTITGGTLTMGASSHSTGTYLLIAGLLTCTNAQEIVGNQGLGNFQQLGGINSLNGGALILGNSSFSTASNTYQLTTGSLTASNASETIGSTGVGIFTQLPGTTNSMTGGMMEIGANSGATGTYSLNGGLLSASNCSEFVGFDGVGIFNHTAGTNSFAGHSLFLGTDAGSTGTYTLGAAGLVIATSADEAVGYSGAGNFNQTGGTNSLDSNSILLIGNNSGSPGTYTLSGGSLSDGGSESVGNGTGSSGVFSQTGGTNTLIGGSLTLSNNAGATGTYTLGSAGQLTADSATEYVGNYGIGNFNQTGGTNSLNGGSLIVGSSAGATGTYTLGAGLLTPFFATEYVGDSGIGNFNQTGGTNSLSNGSLVVGNNAGATGTYTLGTGGLLTTASANEYVGGFGIGNFNQTGGTNSVDGVSNLYVGNIAGSTGTYTLSGGSLQASTQFIGNSGVGNFNQTGGTNNFSNSLTLGNNAGGTGTYTLGAAGLLTSNSGNEYVGKSGAGNFNQTGGTNSIVSAGVLILGYNFLSTGTYTLSGGNLGAPNEFIGDSGTGNFNQTGGTNSLSSTANLVIGTFSSSTGAYSLSGGSLSAPFELVGATGAGNFNQSGGKNAISGANSQLDLANMGSSVGNYNLSGGTLTAPALYVGGSSSGAGGHATFNVNSTGSFTIAGPMQIFGSGAASITGSNPNGGDDSVTSLQISPGGLLTLNTSALTINYGTTTSPNATIRAYISNGYHGAALWTGTTGINSVGAAADAAHHSVAFADGSDGVVTNLPTGISPNAPGGTLAHGSELVTFAFAGDANLDRKVDFSDFIILSNHFGAADINWDHGNFNYDPNIDFADFIVISNNFGDGVGVGNIGTGATPVELAQYNALADSFGISQSQIAAWDATISNLPEPASWGLLAIGAGRLLMRRKRQPNDAVKLKSTRCAKQISGVIQDS